MEILRHIKTEVCQQTTLLPCRFKSKLIYTSFFLVACELEAC